MKGVVRPEASVLPESSLVPEGSLISPAPTQFTHELTRAQPFYFKGARKGARPDGELPAGTKVVLMSHDGGARCRVVDGRGLYVETESEGLREL
jgi:hypothetical protein